MSRSKAGNTIRSNQHFLMPMCCQVFPLEGEAAINQRGATAHPAAAAISLCDGEFDYGCDASSARACGGPCPTS